MYGDLPYTVAFASGKEKLNNMLKIILSDDFLEIPTNAASPFCTVLYVQSDDICFPNDEWTDFTKSVISTWTGNLIRHHGQKSSQYALYFMDGPYRIDVTQNGEELLLQGVCFRKEPQVQFACVCAYRELLREILKAFNSLEKMIFQNGAFTNKDAHRKDIRHYKELIKKELQM